MEEKDEKTVIDPQTGEAVTKTTTVSQTETEPATPDNSDVGTQQASPAVSMDDIRTLVEERFGQTFDNDADLVAFVSDKLSAVGGYEASDAKIQEVLSDYPELLSLVEDLGNGVPFRQALAANIDIDDLRAEEGDDDYAEVEQAAQKRRERAKRAKDYEARVNANMEKSAEVLQQFFADEGMSDEQAQNFADAIDNMINGYIDGNITPDFLRFFQHALNYDADIASAREEGAIKGKNARIDAERERRATETDGMPQGGSAMAVSETEPTSSSDDLFAEIERNNRRNWRR